MSPYQVNVRCMAIPDGIATDGKSLRVSAILAPVADPSGLFELSDWPAQISSADHFCIFFTNGDGSLAHAAKMPCAALSNWNKDDHIRQNASNLWTELFTTFPLDSGSQEVDGFSELRKVCAPTTPGVAGSGKALVGRHKVDTTAARFTLHQQLANRLRDFKNADLQSRFQMFSASREDTDGESTLASALRKWPFRDPAVVTRKDLATHLFDEKRRGDSLGRLTALKEIAATRNQDGAAAARAAANTAVSARWSGARKSLLTELNSFGRSGKSGMDRASRLYQLRNQNFDVSIDEKGIINNRYFLAEHLQGHALLHDLSHPIEKIARLRMRSECEDERSFRTSKIVNGDGVASDDPHQIADAARRKLGGIRSYPTLARFLGFTVDFVMEVPLEDSWNGYVSAFLCQKEHQIEDHNAQAVIRGLDKTACTYQRGKTFIARSSNESGAYGIIKSGVVALPKNRYSLETLDSPKLLQSLLQQSGTHLEADANGADPDSLSSKFPEAHTHGISLLDDGAPERTQSQLQNQTDRDPSMPQVFHAEDLCSGYRADVQRQPANGPTRAWKSLMARRVYFPRIWQAFGLANEADHPYPEFRDRDHGVVRVSPKLVPNNTPGVTADPHDSIASTSQILLTWTGDSLGVPADAPVREAPVDEYRDLGLDVQFAFVGGQENRGPALRWGDTYTFGLRAVMPNGASITLDEAADRYGDGFKTDQISYLPTQDVRPPIVLLTEDPAAAAHGNLFAVPNELDTRIVLRSGQHEVRTQARRALVPARTSFEDAEQSGLMDSQLDRDLPHGAFRDFQRDFETGSFPKTSAPHPAKKHSRQAPPLVAGTLLQLRSEPVDNEMAPYFPETRGRNVSFAFERNRRTPRGFSDRKESRAFWSQGKTPLGAAPLLLEVRRSSATDGGSFAPGRIGMVSGGYTTQQLVVDVALGETVSLWYWAWPDRDMFGKTEFGRSLDIPDEEIEPFLGGTPFNGTSGYGKIDIIHAVERPVLPPAIKKRPASLIRLAPSHSWADATGNTPPTQVDNDLGGTTAYFSGLISFHRNSTNALRCEAAWRDFSDEVAVKRDGTRWSLKPANTIKELFRVQGIPIDCGADFASGTSENDFETYDIAYDEAGKLRALNHNFADGIARKLALRIIATSRFSDEFTPESPPNPAQFECDNRPAFERTGRIDFGEHTDHMWMLATNRPQKPVLDRIAWTTREDVSPTADGRWEVRKTCIPRFYLARPWFASGEDELVALVFGPHDLLDNIGFRPPSPKTNRPPHYCPADAPLRAGWPSPTERVRLETLRGSDLDIFKNNTSFSLIADNICRWGADPIADTMEKQPLQALISPEVFSGHVARAGNLPMPLSHPPSPDSLTQNWIDDPSRVAPVSVLLYKPKFDSVTGLHYVDVDIDAPVHMPFVRLSLARFQPHAARDLWISAPLIANPIQIPAPRTATVTQISDAKLHVEVKGNGYRKQRSPTNVDREDMPPMMNIRLLRKSRRDDAWVAAFEGHGHRIESLRVAPQPAYTSNSSRRDEALLWQTDFTLPAPLNAQQYAVHIDEVDLRFSDNDEGIDSIIEHPALFSCLVPLQ